jgi:molybdate transport system regulatory protein
MPARRAATVPVVRCRAWLEWHGESLLGQGRLALLEALRDRGSISAAARALGVSYRAAWRWIDAMNRAAGTPLVTTSTGGRGGGGATLTAAGESVIEAARCLAVGLAEWNARMDRELAPIFAELAPARPARRRGV